MKSNMVAVFLFSLAILISSCSGDQTKKKTQNASLADITATPAGQQVDLPAPYATPSAAVFSNVIGWPEGKTPTAPDGFRVTRFASGLNNPRWIYVAPSGDIFVSEANSQTSVVSEVKNAVSGKSKSGNNTITLNKIILFRDADHDGKPELQSEFLTGLNQPFGMLIIGNTFYVANTDGIVQYPYQPGQTRITAKGRKIVDLPAGGYNNHWTRNIITNRDSSKIYVTVGSGSNVAEHGIDHEIRRANILELNPDGSGEAIYASGLRNPQGMGWAPGTSTLWTSVNERDELGDMLVPDYLTSVKKGGFYGWPYAYYGRHEDPRVKEKRPDLVNKAIVPDVPLGAHTASLGLAFESKGSWPGRYGGAAYVGQHGSWNSSHLAGYRVGMIPFKNGRPSGKVETFLGGFIADSVNNKVYGRPVGVAFTADEKMLVADDASNTIWQVSAAK